MVPRSAAGWTVAVFGWLAVLLGAFGLIAPTILLAALGFASPTADDTLLFVRASSMASFNMGVYYVVAAATEWRAFFRASALFRLVTFSLFTALVLTGAAPARFFGVAAWEGLGAVATGLGLLVDRARQR